MKKKPGNLNPQLPPSRGIPATESLYLPRHYGKHIQSKGGLNKAIIWDIEDVIDFIFPKEYQPTYFKVGCDFVRLLLEKDRVTQKEIRTFLIEHNYSRSTLENKIIPKLVHFGLIKREREIGGKLGRGRPLILSESLTFTKYLERIAFGWNMLVSTARQRKSKTKEMV